MEKREFDALMKVVEHVSFQLAQALWQEDPEHPIPPFTNRFDGRLESAVGSAFQSFGGKYVIPSLSGRIAALFYYMTRGHCFSNGNKRIALATLLTMIRLQQKWLKATNEELYALSQRVAVSPASKKDEVIDWVRRFISDHLENY